ncbi:hypothetical protein [Microbacterium sp. SGAir0570]|uniref:hypothetical protein n=1 Tax=Microbacterium sp. SGAir0570 TaxID=2070348 RepID=UPI0015E844D7|nr:hypothetical protein [Microbacterium sp. SGAir0570]
MEVDADRPVPTRDIEVERLPEPRLRLKQQRGITLQRELAARHADVEELLVVAII